MKNMQFCFKNKIAAKIYMPFVLIQTFLAILFVESCTQGIREFVGWFNSYCLWAIVSGLVSLVNLAVFMIFGFIKTVPAGTRIPHPLM